MRTDQKADHKSEALKTKEKPRRKKRNKNTLRILFKKQSVYVTQRGPGLVATIETLMGRGKQVFKEQTLRGLFKKEAKTIFGTYTAHRAIRLHFIDRIRAASWEVSWKVSPAVGGGTGFSNMYLRPDYLFLPEILALNARLAEQAKIPLKRKTKVSLPVNSILLPFAGTTPCVPMINDKGRMVQVALPLDQYSKEDLNAFGLWQAADMIGNLKKAMRIKETDGIQSDYYASAHMRRPNRIEEQSRKDQQRARKAARLFSTRKEDIPPQPVKNSPPAPKEDQIDFVTPQAVNDSMPLSSGATPDMLFEARMRPLGDKPAQAESPCKTAVASEPHRPGTTISKEERRRIFETQQKKARDDKAAKKQKPHSPPAILITGHHPRYDGFFEKLPRALAQLEHATYG